MATRETHRYGVGIPLDQVSIWFNGIHLEKEKKLTDIKTRRRTLVEVKILLQGEGGAAMSFGDFIQFDPSRDQYWSQRSDDGGNYSDRPPAFGGNLYGVKYKLPKCMRREDCGQIVDCYTPLSNDLIPAVFKDQYKSIDLNQWVIETGSEGVLCMIDPKLALERVEAFSYNGELYKAVVQNKVLRTRVNEKSLDESTKIWTTPAEFIVACGLVIYKQ